MNHLESFGMFEERESSARDQMRIVLTVDRWGWVAKRREVQLILVSLFLCLSDAGCRPATTAQSKNGAYTPTAASISPDANGTAEAEVSPDRMPKIKDEDLKRLVELKTQVIQNDRAMSKCRGFDDGTRQD